MLNCWGKMRAWGNHMVHHGLYYRQNYSYFGVIEALSGAPFDVAFISFEDIKSDPHFLDPFDDPECGRRRYRPDRRRLLV